MKLLTIQQGIWSASPKNCPLYIQIRYTGFYFLPGSIPNWVGSSFGAFVPRKVKGEYTLTGFFIHPWLAPDVAVCTLPKWYRKFVRAIAYDNFNSSGL